MNEINKQIGKLSQNENIAYLAKSDPAVARLVDRSIWFLVSAVIGFWVEQLTLMIDTNTGFASFLATTATGVLFMRQTRADKKYRDLEKKENEIVVTYE